MRRKRILFYLLIIVFFCPVMVFAQLAIKLELNRKNYIRYENVYAKITLKNLSAHTLVFGSNPKLKGQLKLEIETPSGKKAQLLGKNHSPLFGRVIELGKKESVIVPLSKMYNVRAIGEYKVRAVVAHSQLPDSYQSNLADFKVTAGTMAWKATVGVPTTGKLKDNEKIKSRQYKLLSFFDDMNRVYCLMVEDKKYVYGVARIGYDIGNIKPECKIDRFSKIHILIQSSPQIYSYYVYDTDCHLDAKAVYKKTKTEPRLISNEDTGRVFVVGGEKAKEGSDYVVADEEVK